ncbi:fluoride efflux transporter CrcB [Cohnella laeviribosi]|uniref:fluoride efflux transporter CrcB n=1 Tax=Cohnella laeviribosi TaxID=380174 RepID=UPI0003676FEF|nr:fluoride efflux transporter CrcB [Cohnella laeviribosi]
MLKYQGEGMKGLALAVGAFLGALFRFALGEWIPVLSDRFPLGTMIINLTGCLFLGWFFTITLFRWKWPLEIRLGIGMGLTGSFTTFSTFSLETAQMLENHHFIAAFVYVVSSVLGGIVLVGVGQSIAEFQIRGSRSKGA